MWTIYVLIDKRHQQNTQEFQQNESEEIQRKPYIVFKLLKSRVKGEGGIVILRNNPEVQVLDAFSSKTKKIRR